MILCGLCLMQKQTCSVQYCMKTIGAETCGSIPNLSYIICENPSSSAGKRFVSFFMFFIFNSTLMNSCDYLSSTRGIARKTRKTSGLVSCMQYFQTWLAYSPVSSVPEIYVLYVFRHWHVDISNSIKYQVWSLPYILLSPWIFLAKHTLYILVCSVGYGTVGGFYCINDFLLKCHCQPKYILNREKSDIMLNKNGRM